MLCGAGAAGLLVRVVSMESGLEGRNNGITVTVQPPPECSVSMESGLEGRNNGMYLPMTITNVIGLNGVRPRRPEQCIVQNTNHCGVHMVSMESGLEGRNNSMGNRCSGGKRSVSMESGLEGRNNAQLLRAGALAHLLSQWSPA